MQIPELFFKSTPNQQIFIVVIISLVFLLGVFITHYFQKRRTVDELLFNTRKNIYSRFIKEMGSAFYNKKPDIFINDMDEKIFETENYLRISKIFSETRLVAGEELEFKLREFYEYITDKNKKDEEGRYLTGIEIEALMRKDLHVIGFFELNIIKTFVKIKKIISILNKKYAKRI